MASPKLAQALATLRVATDKAIDVLMQVSIGCSREETAEAIEDTFEDTLDDFIEDLPLSVDTDGFIRGARKHCAGITARIRTGEWEKDQREQRFWEFVRSNKVVRAMEAVPKHDVKARDAKLADLLVEQGKRDPELADEVQTSIETFVSKGWAPDMDAEFRQRKQKHWTDIVARMRGAAE
jgi:hypothetical protein